MDNKKVCIISISHEHKGRYGYRRITAEMNNFFGLLKSELLYLQKFTSIEHFRKELEKYIDYYNNKRIKPALKNMSPVQYRTHAI